MTATMARKAVALPRLRFFSLLSGRLCRVFLSSSCVEKLGLPLARASAGVSVAIRPQRVPGTCASCGTGILFSSFICTFPFIKYKNIFIG